ncbi:hypothetical protein L9F63_010867 [Diploptera punctata]|uniref:DUF1308 domain-containing protein n=1 Tax=Diploptera punctata TaxID=6984 RepID=A0AAD8AH15_DIPPU|nr:hypothetical protein L9F63_010867 [Diploptera punctata]
MDQNYLLKQLEKKIKSGEELLQYISEVKDVNGIDKLKKKIMQEINFLLKVLRSREAKKEHLLCTNLHHFEALARCLISSHGSIAVLRHFTLNRTDGSSKRICVDIVSQDGQCWVKVIARNPKALSQLSTGEGEFGQRSILDHAREYLECACQHPHHFRKPKVGDTSVVFEFACGIEKLLADRLETLGITVCGDRLDIIESLSPEPQGESDDEDSYTSMTTNSQFEDLGGSEHKLNLDVTAMLAYVSNLTNGGNYFEFKEPILTQQAEWERARPVKPTLDKLFKGKCLVCCESAMKDFKSIVSTLGGPDEVRRANELISCITVVPNMISERAQRKLRLGGKIKQRSMIVFSTGDAMRAVTVTANEGFVRAARNQGVEFAVFIHESRALTEGKERDAKVLVSPCNSTLSQSAKS